MDEEEKINLHLRNQITIDLESGEFINTKVFKSFFIFLKTNFKKSLKEDDAATDDELPGPSTTKTIRISRRSTTNRYFIFFIIKNNTFLKIFLALWTV